MNEENFRFEYKDDPSLEDEKVLSDGLEADDLLKKGMKPIRKFGIFIKDTKEIVLGGLTGYILYGCIYVDTLWLKDILRHQGFGTRLMRDAEKIGRESDCTFATVNTMDWEALTFYQKLGYEIEFVREGYDKESKMYMLRKEL